MKFCSGQAKNAIKMKVKWRNNSKFVLGSYGSCAVPQPHPRDHKEGKNVGYRLPAFLLFLTLFLKAFVFKFYKILSHVAKGE